MSEIAGGYTTTHRPGVLVRRDPARTSVPLLVEIPRSGSEYPRSFRSPAPFDAVHRSISMYVEELWGRAPEVGGTWLFASFPNSWIDLNRGELDIDPELLSGPWPGELRPGEKSGLGIGLIHRVCGDGETPLHGGPLAPAEVQARIDGYYRPYHDELAAVLRGFVDAFGVAYHVSCHSMGAVGGSASVDAGQRRCDVDLGDLHGRSCEPELVETARGLLEAKGYEVGVNRHYAGGECIRRHGRPVEGVHSLQIEINRGLYMDEAAFTRSAGFAELERDLATVLEALAGYARQRAEGARS